MSKFKAPLIVLGVVLFIVIVVGGIKALQFKSMAEAGANASIPPSAVSVFAAEKQQWSNSIRAIGTVRADEGITVMAELAGRVESIHFKSGDSVNAGDLLLKQDSSSERAMLKAAEAQLRLAQYNFKQVNELRRKNTVSESQYETAKQDLDAAQANVQNLASAVAKKEIRASFSGRLGIREVDIGEDLRAGSAIVDLYSHNNLKVDFPVPQRWLAQVQPGQAVSVNMIENKDANVAGSISAVGAAVDEITRNIDVQATLENVDGQLLPGMAVEVRVALPEREEFLVVPSTAVIYAPYGDTVFLIEENKDSGQLQARQQFIQIIARRGDFVAIGKGLNVGDKVASAGAFKLFNGQPVIITDNEEAEYSLNPQPQDS
ncbi:efflux RND transporter periplasmic adaptor subunit [Agaribacterium haliotis]|uniref:efflux RND transporter periplasmic adaptor subunit n=1 Tax=Agaribacterium haliotis TaxID=2013869 RepID=UPI000BB5637E|nr:efflux RND transporter periplasmic adaptor subunit [Agaribacterium haliotis]